MKKIIAVAIMLLLAACASRTEKLARQGTVIPKANGYFEAIGEHRNEATALQIALASAEQHCKQRDKYFAVYDESKSAEETLVDERVAKTADMIATAGSMAGRYIPGGNFLRGTKSVSIFGKCE